MRRVRSCLIWALLFLGAQPLWALTSQSEDDILRMWMWQRFIELPQDSRPQIGLALSAGGVRGFAHVGVLEVFDNAGVPSSGTTIIRCLDL